ncbi:hypothetical protein VTN96DRAFT_7705 [Rasamsonia emersonii]
MLAQKPRRRHRFRIHWHRRGDQGDSHGAPQTTIPRNKTDDATAWTGNIGFESFFENRSGDERLSKAQQRLRDATLELKDALQDYAKQHPDRSHEISVIDNKDLATAMEEAGKKPQPEETFGRLIEQVVESRVQRRQRRSGKLASCMTRVYPIATLVLGLVSFSADAAGFIPLKFAVNGLNIVLSNAVDTHNRADDIVKELEVINNYGPYLRKLRELDASHHVLVQATDLLTAMTRFLRTSISYLESHYLQRVIADTIGQKMAESRQALVDARNQLDQAMINEMGTTLLKRRGEEQIDTRVHIEA